MEESMLGIAMTLEWGLLYLPRLFYKTNNFSAFHLSLW